MQYYLSPTGNDSNDGRSTSLAVATLGRLATYLKPGDTVTFLAGTYKLAAPVNVTVSGTPAATINLSASGNVILDGTNLPAGKSILQIGASNITVWGFSLQNSPTGGISIWGASNVKVTACRVQGCQSFGIFAGYSTPGVVSNINIQNCTVTDCCLSNGARTASGGWPAALTCDLCSNVTISGCSVYYNYGEGIDVNHSNGCSVLGNFLHDNFSANIYCDNATNTIVRDNFIFTNNNPSYFRFGVPANGILLANEVAPYPNPLNYITIINNFVIGGNNAIAYGSYGAGGGLVNCVISGNKTFTQVNGALSIDADPGHKNTTITTNQFVTNIPMQQLYHWNNGTAGQAGVVDPIGSNGWFGGVGRGW